MSKISRREFIHISGLAAAGVTLAACAKATDAPVVEPTAATKAEATATPKPADPTPTPEPAPELEAPVLVEQVASGALPPMDERLPDMGRMANGPDGKQCSCATVLWGFSWAMVQTMAVCL